MPFRCITQKSQLLYMVHIKSQMFHMRSVNESFHRIYVLARENGPMSKTLKAVGAQVRTLRKERKLSQEQLAERAHLHYSIIGSVERGQRNITLENLAKIAKGLGVPLRDLFPPEGKHAGSARELGTLLAIADQSTSELILAVAKLIQEKRSVKPPKPAS